LAFSYPASFFADEFGDVGEPVTVLDTYFYGREESALRHAPQGGVGDAELAAGFLGGEEFVLLRSGYGAWAPWAAM